jgi:hypothetical protein
MGANMSDFDGFFVLVCQPEIQSECGFAGGPCRNRTCDQRIKSPLLYRLS